MKFPAKRELPIKWLHNIRTCHNVDHRLISNRKIVCEDHFTEQYFKKDAEHSLLGNSCTDIKPRTPSRTGRLRKVSQSNVLCYRLDVFVSLFFSIDTIIIYRP